MALAVLAILASRIGSKLNGTCRTRFSVEDMVTKERKRIPSREAEA